MVHSKLADLAYNPTPQLPLPKDRKPQGRAGVNLPEGTVVVSADTHCSIAEDIFYEGFPERLKDRAPRIRNVDGGLVIFDASGKPLSPDFITRGFSGYDLLPGTSQIRPRLADMDAEGVQKEIVFPNAVLGFLYHPDYELREWVFKTYNEYLLKTAAQAPGRFYGVALPNYWDLARARENFAELKSQGFKTFLLPLKPRGADGKEISYAAPEMEPLWHAIEEAGLPVCFHIGENHSFGRGGYGTSALTNFSPFRQVFGHLLFGGILDRHPKLQVVFVEGGINWVPSVLQDAAMFRRAHHEFHDWEMHHAPRYYWENHCCATFMQDPLGLSMLDLIGVDRVMWTSDYPHFEGTFGLGWDSIQQVLDVAKTDDDARAILGENAIRVFDLV